MNRIRWSVLQKNLNFYSIDFLHFFAKRRKSVEKMTHRKKNEVTERPRSLNLHKVVIAMAICPNCPLYYLARARCMTWRIEKDFLCLCYCHKPGGKTGRAKSGWRKERGLLSSGILQGDFFVAPFFASRTTDLAKKGTTCS